MCAIPVPFDAKAVFGKTRAPVTVTLKGYRYRSTIAVMGGEAWIPLRRSHREAAGLSGSETLTVTIARDDAPREVAPPADLAAVLTATPGAQAAWDALSFTHKREHVEAFEGAKKPETRARRIQAALTLLTRTRGRRG